MGTYTTDEQQIAFGLEEVGFRHGLKRLESEELDSYRRRLLLEARDPRGSTEAQFIRGINRQVGLFEIPVFEIDLIRDANNIPLAIDPLIEVTSSFIRAYDDFTNNSLDIELSIIDRSDAYFLREVQLAFAASTFFSIDILDPNYTFKYSRQLRYGSTERFVDSELGVESRSVKLKNELIRNIYPQNLLLFQNEVASESLIAQLGDFYIDYINGVVFVYEPMTGLISYSYKMFPYTLYWQPVRTWPYNDKDKKFRLYNTLIDHDTGLEENVLLNIEGAEIANSILVVHSLEWGK